MSTITSPHDKLFKTTMSDVRVAREFFENYLPQNVKKFINLNKLELSPKSYVDENLKALESDILYKTQLGDEQAYLYLLAEHQSSPDKLMAFRLLKYIVAIWTDTLKQAEQEDGSNFVQTLLNYLLTTAEIPDLDIFVETVKEGLSAPTGEKIMTLAQQLHERGYIQGEHALFTRLLKRKFNAVPSHYQKLLEQADETKINKWSENLIDAKTLDEVFGN